jgi:signal transduction histidine kinase/CheY-like chemotaxis protein
MRIKTGLQMGAVLPIVMAILVSLGLLVRSQEMRKIGSALEFSESLATEVAELDVLTHKYISAPTAQVRAAWHKRHDAAGQVIEGMSSAAFLETLSIDRMRSAHRIAGKRFAMLSSILENRTAGGVSPHALRKDRITDELLDQVRTMQVELVRFSSFAFSSSASIQQNIDTVVAALFGVLALATAWGTLVVARNFTGRLSTVRTGLRALSDGNLGHRLETKGTDEIAQIAILFNSAAGVLKSSQKTLSEEAANHRRLTEALRESNMMLSDTLTKLKRAQRRVIDSERMSALGQMASGIAHDFNNCLTPILGLSDFLLAFPDQIDDKEAVIEHMKTINEAVRRAREQTKRQSEFFRPRKEKYAHTVNLNDLVEQAIVMTQPAWREEKKAMGIAVTVKSELGNLPMIGASAVGLRDALTHLILNALDAMPSGGVITISTSREGGNVVLKVRDSGEGMCEDVRRHCFEPFFSTKGISSAGMGLTIVSSVARTHGGEVDIETAPDAGTTVIVKLPITSSAPAAEADEEPVPPIGRSLRILLVDDDLRTRRVYSTSLFADGHKVESAADGEAALKLFRADPAFDLVFVDRAMPKMSGDELAVQLKELSPELPIILLSGFGDVMLEKGEHPASVDYILSKPAAIEDIRRAIAKTAVTRPVSS